MGKPFRIPPPPQPRDAAGRYVPPSPPQVIDAARAAGVPVLDYVHTVQAPEHPTPGGRRGVAEELPPIAAMPPAQKPFRVK